MAELYKQESELQHALKLNMTLQDVRSVLDANKIQFHELIEKSDGVVFQTPDRKITAGAGDRVLFSEFQTPAFRFPCGYNLSIILVFGRDKRLKEQYIHRLPMCP